MVIIGLFLLLPLAQLVGLSFSYWNGYTAIRFDGFDTWSALFADPNFQAALKNTLIWTAASAIVPVLLGSILAFVFHRAGARIGGFGRALVVVPLLLPATVAAATWSIMYNPLYGPLDSILAGINWKLSLGRLTIPIDMASHVPNWLGDPSIALWSIFGITVWNTVGLTVLIVTASIRAIDRGYFDIARAEGGGIWAEARHILFPATRRGIALAAIISVVLASQVEDMLLELNTNGGPDNSTLMLPLDMYFKSFSGLGNVGEGAAEACVMILIVLLVGAVALLSARGSHSMAGEGDFAAPPRGRPLAIVLTLLAVVALVSPLFWDCMAALTSGQLIVIQPVTSALSQPSLASFASVWNLGLGTGLWESLVIAAVVVMGSLALSVPAAYGLSLIGRHRIVRALILAVLVFTLMQPGDTFVITLYYLLLSLHLLNTATGLILAEISRELPFTIVLLWIAMITLPRDVIAAAQLDGGKGLQILARVVLPLAWPAAAVAVLWVFISSWSEYALPYQLLSTSPIQTAPMALNTLAGTHDTQFNLLGAGTLLMVVPVLFGLLLVYGPAARWLRTASRAVNRG